MANLTALQSLIPPGACKADGAWTTSGNLMFYVCIYAVVLAVVCTALSMYVYKKHGMHDAVDRQVQRFGTLWVISTFFLALGVYISGHVVACTLGCGTYAVECASISCVVANHVPEGYVILGILLLVACVSILMNVNDLALLRLSNADTTMLSSMQSFMGADLLAPLGEWLLRVGFVLTVVTGLVPSPSSNCGMQPPEVTEVTGDDCFNHVMGMLHANGIIYGLVLAILGALFRCFAPRRVGDGWQCFDFRGHPLIALLALISIAFLLFLGVAFLVVYVQNDNGSAATMDFCTHYESQASCEGRQLPSAWYVWASRRKMNDKPPHIPALTRDGWQCAWYDNIATVSRSGCMRVDCDKDGKWLDGRKLAIVAEFLGLVTGVYGIYFIIWTINIMDHVIKEKSPEKSEV